jgi:CheY-like chemotaxis protein
VCGEENARLLREFSFHSKAIAKKTRIEREYMPYGKVLVVDDVKSNLYVAKGLLSVYGLQIDAIESGVLAVEKIKSGNVYDIIFIDHLMPVMDGIEAVKIMRGLGYDRPIIALTANAIAGQTEMFMQNGFDGYIPKPIDSLKLDALLNELIRDKKPTEVVEAARREKLKEDHAEKRINLSELEKYFLIDAKNAVDKLEKICGKTGLGDNDITSYEITVHSMKSALANIGEKRLSKTALRLEEAAQERNTAVIQEEAPAFINTLKSFIEKTALVKENAGAEITAEDEAYLQIKLLEVKTACDLINKKAIDAAMDDLKQKKWPRMINEVLDALSVYILHSDFEKAASIAEKTAQNGIGILA